MYLNNKRFYDALLLPPKDRTQEDLNIIYNYLRKLDIFSCLNDSPLRVVCKTARLERHSSNHVLFRKGQVATCWYILLNGSVYMNKQIYMPIGCFGKRNGMNLRRNSDCILLQNSDIIVIDYPDVQRIPVVHNPTSSQSHQEQGSSIFHKKTKSKGDYSSLDHSKPQSTIKLPSNSSSTSSSNSHFNATTVTITGDHYISKPKMNEFHEPAKWYVSTYVPSSSGQPVVHERAASVGPHMLERQLNDNKVKNATASISVGAQNLEQSNISPSTGHSVTPMRSSLPTSHKSMPPPPPPVSSNSSSMIPFSGRAEHETTSNVLSHRFSKARFLRKNSDDAGPNVLKVRTLSGNQSSINNATRRLRVRSTASSSTTEGDDFSGLPEAPVDSEDEDDESCPSHDSYQELKDNVRECLEKEPTERNSDDISILMEFMQQMPALACLPLSIKRQLCLKMVFAVVPIAGTTILQHGEKIDSWSIIVNGAVEHRTTDGVKKEYRLGDCFGAKPIPTPQYHEGEMKTLVDDCEFVLVEHSDFCTIMSTVNQHIEKESDNLTGEIVSETERRMIGNQVGLVLIKGKPEKLIQHLIDDFDINIDTQYTEDFLLMYRVFINNPMEIMEKLLQWFQDPIIRDKIARILLLWVNNHFNDFEINKELSDALDKFENEFEKVNMYNQQALLNITCSVKSRPRTIILTRSNREQELSFNILGGKESNNGLFISYVEPESIADKNGLKRGDEILEINGQSCRNFTLSKAIDILRESTHLSLLLKSNIMGFKEMLLYQEKMLNVVDDFNDAVITEKSTGNTATPGTFGRFKKNFSTHGRRSTLNVLPTSTGGNIVRPVSMGNNAQQTANSWSSNSSASSQGSTAKSSMFEKLFGMLKSNNNSNNTDVADEAKMPQTLRTSRSNPDISGHLIKHQYQQYQNECLGNPSGETQLPMEQAIKIYRSDQSVRYLTIFPETTAKNVVQLALQEFGMTNEGASTDWSLCECTITAEGVNKQRRLPDDMCTLAERIGLNSRFYLKNNTKSENLIPDELAPEILKEAKISLHNLNALYVATQLTLQDFAAFSSIESTEYVDNLFNIQSSYGWPQLTDFENLFNKEMWWVVTEICNEKNLSKRVKLIKKFIKIARHCRELKNFNSMFAIISGLEKPAVKRLTHSWERISGKYSRMLAEVESLIDPTRNMSKYRQHLISVSMDPPVIPIYPILRKDLIFSHEANSTWSDKLINFEKLRKIASIIRSTIRYSSVSYDLDILMQPGFSGDLTAATMRKSTNAGINTGKQLATQSRKKLYEQTMMIKKVKAYLNNLQVIESETELDKMSYECEPAQQSSSSFGNSNSSVPPRRRGPSPSPSSLSSHSNQSDQRNQLQQKFVPKFGVESPQAVQKMLSLVQNSKVKTQANAKNASNSLMSSKKSSSSSLTVSTMATIDSSNGATYQGSQRFPSFNYNSDEIEYKEMGVDVDPD